MTTTIVTADKPGREVVVDTQVDTHRRLVVLQVGSLQPDGLDDGWTWLAPLEARQVAAALIAAADALEQQR